MQPSISSGATPSLVGETPAMELLAPGETPKTIGRRAVALAGLGGLLGIGAAQAQTVGPSPIASSATNATNATNGATVAIATNASFFPLFVASSTNGNQPFNLDANLTYNPSTDTLTASIFAGRLSGTYVTQSAGPWLLASASSQSNVTGDGTNYTLLWPTELKDRGSNFASPTWTAPFTGGYAFSGVLQLSGLGVTDTSAIMTAVATSRTQNVFEINPGVALVGGNVEMPFSGTVDMTAADTLVFKILVNGSSGKTTDIETDSRLSIFFFG